MYLQVAKIQRFSTHDGPGVRTVIFLKGCPLRCKWCHNPETQDVETQIMFHPQKCLSCQLCAQVCKNGAHTFALDTPPVPAAPHAPAAPLAPAAAPVHEFHSAQCKACMSCTENCPTGAIESVGKQMMVEDILEIVLRDKEFYGQEGGITISGGEPMFQPDGTLELLRQAKKLGLNTAVETCGHFHEQYLETLCKLTDTFLWDLKDGNANRHKEFTGVDNCLLTQNLQKASQILSGTQRIIVRCILVRGVNNDTTNFQSIADTVHSMCHYEGVELIPYHPYGSSKAVQLGRSDPANTSWIPDEKDIAFAIDYLTCAGVFILTKFSP